MPSYPAKPYIVPHDDWFTNNSTNFVNKSITKETKNITTIHEFFYRQSDIKVGGSENQIQRNLEKESSKKIMTSIQNLDEKSFSRSKEKYRYYKNPTELKSIKKIFKGQFI